MKPSPPRATGTIDWTAVRERLASASAATASALELPPDRARAVMDERARLLARPLAEREAPGQLVEVLTFSLGREAYAIESKHVREVVRLVDYTPVPGTPEFLLGVINLRGEILAIADLRKLLGVAPQGFTDLSRVIVLGGDRAEFGILADAAHENRVLLATQILEPTGAAGGIGREHLRGVTSEGLIVLEGRMLLGDSRLFIGGERDDAATRPMGRGPT